MINWNRNDSFLCFIGGLLIGTVAGCRMLIFGKVTGISGILSGFVEIKKKDFSDLDLLTRASFLTGLVVNHFVIDILIICSFLCLLLIYLQCAGILANHFLSDCFQSWKPFPISRLVVAGFLVGFGTTSGNGCTSGHGVCGISAFRLRSIFATCTFMAAGVITAIVTDTSSFLPVFSNSLDVNNAGIVIVTCVATCLTMTAFAIAIRSYMGENLAKFKPVLFILAVFFEWIFGISFGLALAVANMTRLSATIAFLDLRFFNPALAFVMASAIAVTTFAYYLAGKRPFPFLDIKFYRPVGSIVDAKLFLGEVIFGVGWGLAGACPGPAVANLGTGSVLSVLYVGCIVAGMWTQHICNPFLTKALEAIIFFGQKAPSADSNKVGNQKQT